MTNTCPTCTDDLCPACQAAAIERQAWLDAQAHGDYWLTDEATNRYNEAQWARSGTNYIKEINHV